MSAQLEKISCTKIALKASFVFLFTNLLILPHVLIADSTTVWWQSWKQVYQGYPFDTPGTTPTNVQELRGRDLTGAARDLYQGSDGQSLDGDLVELGYYKLSDNSANTSNTNLFKGTWTPLTTKTTIGHNYYLSGSYNSGSTAGQFHFSTKFSVTGTPSVDDTAITNHELNNAYEISNDTFSSLSDEVTRLEAGNDAGGTNYARLGIRFYETGSRSSASAGGLTKDDTVGHVLYNTVMAETWRWVDTDTGGLGDQHLYIQLHDPTSNSAMTSGLAFEFDNNTHNAYSKVGSSSGAVGTDNYVTSLTYHDGDDSIDLDAVGSANFSGLSGTGNITDTENAVFRTVTLHTAAGNMGNDGTSFAGDISGDITLIKTGGTAGNGTNDGEQTLTGTIAITDTSGSDGEGYLDIKGGTLILAPATGKTQSFEYITGAGNLDLVNDNGQTVELGFTTATSAQTFSGTVALSGTGTATTIKVSSGTAAGDYNDEQVFSGQVTGSETLTKSGVGRLKLSNSGNDFTNTGGTDVIIDDGTLVASHANALGGASNTVVINKGKLELEGGISLANTSIQGSASGKSMVGGDGTFAAISVGDGTNDIKAISPGRGISSSLSPSNHQATLGTGGSENNAIGNLTVTTLTFNDGAVFDWEISDFNSGVNQNSFNADEDFDILNFGTLAFGSNAVVDLNIFSVDSNGAAGAVANLGVHDHTTNDGILFLNGGSHGSITNWGGTTLASGSWSDASSHFSVNDHAYNFHNGNLHGGWGVWYNGSGDFYLRYSAVPEPSTYVMVTGLLLLPGFRLIRRFRKSFGKSDEDSSSS